MIEPTERLLWSVVAVGLVGVCGFVAPAVGEAAPFVLAGVVVLALLDAVWAGSPSAIVVHRRVADRAVDGKDVAIGLELSAPFAADVELTDSLALLRPAWTTARVRVVPDELCTVRTVRRSLRRGDAGDGEFAIRTHGPLGLIRRRHRRPGSGDPILIAADVAAIAQTAERLVRGGASDGSRRKRAIEQGREMDALREYRRGDDVRHVDWKATARRGELIVKELVPETRQDVVVIVDAGRQQLGTGDNGRPRLDNALQVALVLCAAALGKGDRAGICLLDDEVRAFIPPREGRAQLGRLAEAVRDADAVAVEPAYQDVAALLTRRQKRRALICLVTDVVDEAGARALARALVGLRGRHLALVVALGEEGIARLAHDEPAPTDALAPWLQDAAVSLLGHRKRALAALQASGAVVVDTAGAKAPGAAVEAYLDLKARGRL